MSIGQRRTIGIDRTRARLDKAAVGAALVVLDRFMAALNVDDEPALLATLHFPHDRLAGPGAGVGSTWRRCRRLFLPVRRGPAPQRVE
jgi:hypothetical protein